MVLFISFGYFDEVRALSLAFPALTLIALSAVLPILYLKRRGWI